MSLASSDLPDRRGEDYVGRAPLELPRGDRRVSRGRWHIPVRHSIWRPSRLLRNSLDLMASSAASAGLGLVFWAVAARVAPAADVGRNSAEVAAMTLLASLAQLGLPNVVNRFLPVAAERSGRFLYRCYVTSAVVAVLIAVVYVVAGLGNGFLPHFWAGRALFVVSVPVWVIFVIQDAALVGVHRSKWIPVENTLFSAAKLAILVPLVGYSARSGLFVAWALPMLAAVAVVNWYLVQRALPKHMASSTRQSGLPSLRGIVSFVAGDYVANVLGVVSALVLPLIVLERLGATATAHFYLPWTVAAAFGQLTWNLTTSFVAEAAFEGQLTRRLARRAIRIGLALIIPVVVIGVALAPFVLDIFGREYSRESTTLLRLLLLGLLGTAVNAFYSAIAWIDRTVWRLAIRQMLTGATLIGVTVATITHLGITAVGVGVVATEGAEVALMLPACVRRYRRMPSGLGSGPTLVGPTASGAVMPE